jgi:hypothetical protein
MYFNPLKKMASYRPLLHLMVINFPFALAVWIYLFVGTLVGTTLLLTLPLGAVVWWLTLIGSRTFANTELYLQSKFHSPLPTRTLRPPRPIFKRLRSTTSPETTSSTHLEDGETQTLEYETSFLRNTYAMFLDPTSYQPIFYFLVIKASITLVLTPLLLAIVPVSFILVLPAPAILRIVRLIGLWQARVAFDGLS